MLHELEGLREEIEKDQIFDADEIDDGITSDFTDINQTLLPTLHWLKSTDQSISQDELVYFLGPWLKIKLLKEGYLSQEFNDEMKERLGLSDRALLDEDVIKSEFMLRLVEEPLYITEHDDEEERL